MSKPLDRVTLFALLLLLISALVGGASAQDAGILRVGMNAPVVLDPALHTNDPETAFNRAIYDYLIDVQPDSSLAPNLATEWTISEDDLTYTFTLAEGVTFHDGTPFTSADVLYTFNRLVEVASPALSLLGEFTIAAPDAQTVVFTIPAVNADFLYGVAARQAFIVQDGVTDVNVLGEGDAQYANFNGTGAFVLSEYSPGARAVFTANENYWKADAPLLAGLEFVYIEDTVAQVDALLGGQVDFIFKVPIQQIDRLEGDANITVIEQATSQHAVIRLRTDAGSLGENVLVRQALKLATDRDQLNDILLSGRGIVGNNDPIAPSFGSFYATETPVQEYDPARACELLTEAGVNPLETSLYVPNAFEYPDLATLLQEQWSATGCINVDIQQREEGYYYDVSNADNYFDVQLGITGWGARATPQILLREAYIESGIATGFNESRFIDPEIEALVTEASMTTDDDARRDLYAQISAIFYERGPIIIPYFAPLIGATSANVSSLTIHPFPGLTDYRTVSLTAGV